MPTLRIETVPVAKYFPARSSVELMRPIATSVIDNIIKALTTPLTEEEKNPKPVVREDVTKPIRFTGKSYNAVLEELNQSFLDNRWTDGLPVIPPTKEAVDWMLTGTSRSPDEVLGKIGPKNGIVTIEKIAINAVMAGARPEYLPVIIAAVECIADPGYLSVHMQASMASAVPVIIVNGPIAEEIGMNFGLGYLGHGWRANSTIGRAVGLCMTNFGHVWPAVNDMGATGRPERYCNWTFPENEKLSPWEPYHVELGYKSDQSTVTVSSQLRCNRYGPSPGGGVQSQTAQQALDGIASILASYGSTPATDMLLIKMSRYLIAVPPTLARLLAELGYTKESLKRWLWENARLPWDKLIPTNQEQVRGHAEAGRLPGITLEDCKPGGMLPVFTLGAPQPEGDRLNIFVGGGEPGFTVMWGFLGPENQQLTKLIHGATLTKAGRN